MSIKRYQTEDIVRHLREADVIRLSAGMITETSAFIFLPWANRESSLDLRQQFGLPDKQFSEP